MKEEVKVMELDRSEQGAVLTALNDLRNKRISEYKSTNTVDDLIEELFSAPTKKVKVRSGDAR
ncbi:MAG: hypothetical protein PHV32_18450 [Eubacteriales bacterium]|nr:hypothetical protein [Eubacteriales bacterium]